MKKFVIMSVVALTGVFTCVADTNMSVSAPPSLQSGISETFASGWVPGTSWKMVYTKPVMQSEVYGQWNTPECPLIKATRLTIWAQNPIEEKGAFTQPAGEMDYFIGLTGPTLVGVKTLFEVRFIDVGGANGERVGTFGDKDCLRLRTRLEYPISLAKDNLLTPSFTWFHVEPVTYRPNVVGDTVCLQLLDEWKPLQWLKLAANIGFLHDEGVNGGIPADVTSCGMSVGVRLFKKAPECWLVGSIQGYSTIGSPSNRPYRDFGVASVGVNAKF
ncbi:MAG: hypothetical protein WCO48_03320 [Candidatus Taylorbacteria bacterium]